MESRARSAATHTEVSTQIIGAGDGGTGRCRQSRVTDPRRSLSSSIRFLRISSRSESTTVSVFDLNPSSRCASSSRSAGRSNVVRIRQSYIAMRPDALFFIDMRAGTPAGRRLPLVSGDGLGFCPLRSGRADFPAISRGGHVDYGNSGHTGGGEMISTSCFPRRLAAAVAAVAAAAAFAPGAAGGLPGPLALAAGQPAQDGVHTASQAENGRAVYTRSCAICHRTDLPRQLRNRRRWPAPTS